MCILCLYLSYCNKLTWSSSTFNVTQCLHGRDHLWRLPFLDGDNSSLLLHVQSLYVVKGVTPAPIVFFS
jgi:hypothetical protein